MTLVFQKVDLLRSYLDEERKRGKKIGFVPTMGALHEGHAGLMRKAKSDNDLVVVSVFVNPTQFNNSEDLEKYPRTLSADLALLEEENIDVVFTPEVGDVYPRGFAKIELNLGSLDKVMEGSSRPGHFNGVVNVVKRLFDIVEPEKAYFGQKDFQQVAVIRHMISSLHLPVEMVVVETKREPNGLAMSSRNMRLNPEERKEAEHIYRILNASKNRIPELTPREVKVWMETEFEKTKLIVDYISIVDPISLEELNENWVNATVCCVAVYCGQVRLIDNLTLVEQ